MSKKVVVFAVVIAMIAAIGIIPLASDVESTTGAEGQFNVYVNDGSGWSNSQTVAAYDACIAITSYASSNNLTLVIDSATYTESYGYKNINVNYGNITTLGSKTEDSTSKWNVIYYPATGSAWTLGPNDALGLYKPYADYNATYRTANIALYYGTEAEAQDTIASLPVTGLASVVSLSEIQNNSAFRASFFIKIESDDVDDLLDRVSQAEGGELSVNNLPSVTKETLSNGITIQGYGSDLYLALKDAIGDSNISAVEDVPGYNNGSSLSNYSWMYSMFGLGTALLDNKGDDDWSNDIYSWWTQYTSFSDDDVASNDVKSDFVLGYYSPVSGAPNTMNSYSLIYSEGTA